VNVAKVATMLKKMVSLETNLDAYSDVVNLRRNNARKHMIALRATKLNLHASGARRNEYAQYHVKSLNYICSLCIIKKGRKMKRNSKSTLLMVAGTLGFLTTVGLAIWNSKKEECSDDVADHKRWLKDSIDYYPEGEFTKKDVVKNAARLAIAEAKVYAPTLIAGGATLFCFWASHQVNVKSITALATSSALTSKLLKDYKQEMKKVLTPEQLDKVRKQVAEKRGTDIQQKKVDVAHPATMDAPGEVTANLIDGEKEHLFYEEWANRWFRAPLCSVMGAEMSVNRSLATTGSATLSQFYGYLGIDAPDVVKGLENSYGWDVEQIGCMSGDYWLDFDHTKSITENGEEYYIIGFDYAPIDREQLYYAENDWEKEIGYDLKNRVED
jgi:hypothetical protein